MPSAVLAFSDTIAGTVKRQRTAPVYAPVSTVEKPARQTRSKSRLIVKWPFVIHSNL